MMTKVYLFVCAFALISCSAFAQNGNSEVSASFTGNFQQQAMGEGVTDAPSYSGGFVVNYRYHFNRWSALEVNYGYSRFSHFYNSGFSTVANDNEATFAYLFTFGVPQGARLHPFVEAGTGALIFVPNTNESAGGALTQDRAAFLYGAGASYRLTSHLGVQLGYRGLIYRDPDFALSEQFTNAMTHMAEPYAGLTLRF